MKILLSIIIFSFIGVCAHAAGRADDQTVTRLLMDFNYPDRIFIKLSGTNTNKPACATHPVWDFILDTSTQHGMLMYTLIVKAYDDGSPLELGLGTGTCEQSTEKLRRLELEDLSNLP